MAKKNIQITYVVTDAALLKSESALRQNEKAAKDADNAINKFGSDAKKAGDGASKSFLDLGTIWKGLIAIGITRFVVDLGKQILDLGIKQEQLNISFTTFLGSAEKAKKLLGDLTKFAIVTPFTPDQVNSAAKALLAFGVAGEDIIPTLKMLGDVSSGTGKDLTEMAVIFGQIRSTGRLMGQDLLQLINAGFNPLQVISQKTGRAVADLKKDMEKGLITFDMVSDAFKSATSEGGLFFNLMEKQSKSVGGLLSTVSGNIDEVLKNIFAANSGPIKEFTDLLVGLSEAFLAVSKSEEQWADERAQFQNNIFVEGFKAYATAFKDVQSAQEANNKSLDVEAERLQARVSEIESSTTKLTDAQISEYDAALERLRLIPIEKKTVEDYVLTLTKKDDVQKNNVLTLEKLRDESKKLADQIDKTAITDREEITRLTDKKKALDDYIKSLTTATDAKFKLQGTDIVKDNSLTPEKVQAQKFSLSGSDLRNDIFSGIDQIKTDQEKLAEIKLANDNQLTEWQREADAEVAIEQQKQQQKQQLQQAAFSMGANLIQQLFTLSTQASNQTFEREKGDFDKRLALAGDNENAKKAIEVERQAFEEQQDKKQAVFEKKQAERQKELQIKQMIIQNISNALRALGTPPVPNFPLAALTLGFGVAEIVAAKAIGFKEGIIGLDGPGNGTSDSIPARLSKGESVITAKATERSHDLLEAINDGRIDDRILRKLTVTNGGIRIENNNEKLVDEIRNIKISRYEDGYFTMNEIEMSKGFKRKMKSKYRS